MEFYDLVREGQQEFVSDDVRRLLEQTPTNVEGFLQKHLIDVSLRLAKSGFRIADGVDRYRSRFPTAPS